MVVRDSSPLKVVSAQTETIACYNQSLYCSEIFISSMEDGYKSLGFPHLSHKIIENLT